MLTQADKNMLIRAGRLKFLLHADQQLVYDKFTAWQRRRIEARKAGVRPKGKYPRIFVVDASRRFGKDWFGLTVMCARAIQKKNASLTYATAHKKDIEDIVNSAELLKKLTDDFPNDCRPVYKTSFKGQPEGLYFPNGSIIKLVGIDLNPDGLRGRGSDGACVSEAAFCADLDRTVETVLLPQFMGREDAFLMMNSTPPDSGSSPWDMEFVPDARDRDAYVLRTIWDAPQYPDWEKYEFLKIDGDQIEQICRDRNYTPEERKKFLDEGCEGRVAPRQQREYLCIRTRESSSVVLPEFNEKTHVREFEVPEYGHGYVSIDPAVKDLCAVNFAVWDFANARLLVLDEWTKRNANTNEIVDVIREKESALWHNYSYFDGKSLKANPYMRVSDVDMRMITDMKQLHGLSVQPSQKDDAEAALHSLRDAFLAGKIWIHPRCKNTIEHCLGAIWNKARTSFQRSERLGHCDHVDSLKYLWRAVARSKNPYPPQGYIAAQKQGRANIHLTEAHLRHPTSVLSKLNSLFPSTWSRRR